MTLPKGFIFNQSNLQDYVDCQKRFQLRYLFHLDWPAIEVEPFLENEHLIDHGLRFHKTVHQHLIGIPEPAIERSIPKNEKTYTYWTNYLHAHKAGCLSNLFQPGNKYFTEQTFSISLDKFRWVAKYDLLIFHPEGKLTILDWKTTAKPPSRRWLADRVQTRLYPLILANISTGMTWINQGDSNQIEMIYWFTNQPEQPEIFRYDQQIYESDLKFFLGIIAELDQKVNLDYRMTENEIQCAYCTYRSLCRRGIKAGSLYQREEFLEDDIIPNNVMVGLDQISEKEF